MAAEMVTVVTRKGQVTIPAAIRRSLGIKEGDTVTVAVEGDAVKLRPTRTSIRDFYQSVPALTPARTWAGESGRAPVRSSGGRGAPECVRREWVSPVEFRGQSGCIASWGEPIY